jgi:hypothetical protein
MIDTFTRKFRNLGLDRKPKYMFGISSGASFAIKFPRSHAHRGRHQR